MILGGMGPYVEPKSDGGKLFEGFYALYSGLLLVGVSGLILAPTIHHVMHLYHLAEQTPTRSRQSANSPIARPKLGTPRYMFAGFAIIAAMVLFFATAGALVEWWDTTWARSS